MSASRDAAGTSGGTARGNLYDLCAAGAGALLFTLAVLIGRPLEEGEGVLVLRWPPLYAHWFPHAGPGTPAALVVAALVVAYGPETARRLPARALAPACWGAALAWSTSLALIDGWRMGVAGRLTTVHEYLGSVGEVRDLGAFLHAFTGRILIDSPGHWPAHVAGHPPGALLTFVGLDRLGLHGGGWAGVFVLLVGSSAAAAVIVTLRALGGEVPARRAAPFLALAPAAVWMGVSADGCFTAVGAWAVALLALAVTRTVRRPPLAALGSGLLFGLLCFLSYGLVLLGAVALAVLVAAHRHLRVPVRALALSVVLVGVGMACWFVLFAAGGFSWWEGYVTLHQRYYQGAGGFRPYGYFVWANLAVQCVVLGPAVLAGLRRAAALRRGALVTLATGALAALLLADASGLSKAETERIWLPFTLWLLPLAALLPRGTVRWWLTAQATLALAVNHLLMTGW
ncbi:hypothetical protein [Streptomyces sp. ODS28]|uniref:hypothetical protein n=1 Tax=Streptomyces sp. ODS28 TaxID=3136688 RepID=UPI0031F14146